MYARTINEKIINLKTMEVSLWEGLEKGRGELL